VVKNQNCGRAKNIQTANQIQVRLGIDLNMGNARDHAAYFIENNPRTSTWRTKGRTELNEGGSHPQITADIGSGQMFSLMRQLGPTWGTHDGDRTFNGGGEISQISCWFATHLSKLPIDSASVHAKRGRNQQHSDQHHKTCHEMTNPRPR